jgi:hypothetical protein
MGYAGMVAGGALTGYVASGGEMRGALSGALVHTALFSFGYAFIGRDRFPTSATVGFATAGLAAAVAVGYLFTGTRKKRR